MYNPLCSTPFSPHGLPCWPPPPGVKQAHSVDRFFLGSYSNQPHRNFYGWGSIFRVRCHRRPGCPPCPPPLCLPGLWLRGSSRVPSRTGPLYTPTGLESEGPRPAPSLAALDPRRHCPSPPPQLNFLLPSLSSATDPPLWDRGLLLLFSIVFFIQMRPLLRSPPPPVSQCPVLPGPSAVRQTACPIPLWAGQLPRADRPAYLGPLDRPPRRPLFWPTICRCWPRFPPTRFPGCIHSVRMPSGAEPGGGGAGGHAFTSLFG